MHANAEGEPKLSAPFVRLVAAAVGVVGILIGMRLTWVQGRVGAAERGFALGSLSIARVLVGVALVAVVVPLAVSEAQRRVGLVMVQVAGASIILWSSVGVVLVGESLGAMVSSDRLPATIRRLALETAPGYGPWFMAFAAGWLLICVTDAGDPPFEFLHGLLRDLAVTGGPALGAALSICGAMGLGVARYLPWFQVDSPLGPWDVPGWGLPWVGMGTLVALITAVALSVSALRRPTLGTGLVLAALGVGLGFTAGLVLAITLGLGTFEAPDWLAEPIERWTHEAQEATRQTPAESIADAIPEELTVVATVGDGAIVAYLSGLVMAFGGGLIAFRCTEREERWNTQPIS